MTDYAARRINTRDIGVAHIEQADKPKMTKFELEFMGLEPHEMGELKALLKETVEGKISEWNFPKGDDTPVTGKVIN